MLSSTIPHLTFVLILPRAVCTQYRSAEAKFFSEINELSQKAQVKVDGVQPFMSPANWAVVDRICETLRPAVMISGPNGVGKSSLINCLLGAPLMKAEGGFVTARACRLVYCENPQSVRIAFSRLDLGQKKLAQVDPKEIAPISLRVVKDVSDLVTVLAPLLDREKAPGKPGTPAFLHWVTTIVEVRTLHINLLMN